jgi:TnsA endonuclease-like protein
MSFRKISNAGRRINVCKFPSKKMRRNVWTESIMELCLAYLCERDPTVVSYLTQAIRIYYELNGKRCSYTADFLIYREDQRPLIVEVKCERRITPWFEQLFRIVTPICDLAGYDFLVYTEHQIRIEPFLTTIKRLWYHSRTPILPHHQLLCHEFFATRAESTLRELFEFFIKRNVDKSVVLALLYHDVISTDLSIPLGLNSPISYPTTKTEDKENQS